MEILTILTISIIILVLLAAAMSYISLISFYEIFSLLLGIIAFSIGTFLAASYIYFYGINVAAIAFFIIFFISAIVFTKLLIDEITL